MNSTGVAEHLVRAAFHPVGLLLYGSVRRVGDPLFHPIPYPLQLVLWEGRSVNNFCLFFRLVTNYALLHKIAHKQ